MESAAGSSEDLATKCRRALKSVVAKLTALPALDALVHQALPEGIMKMVLEQVGLLLLLLAGCTAHVLAQLLRHGCTACQCFKHISYMGATTVKETCLGTQNGVTHHPRTCWTDLFVLHNVHHLSSDPACMCAPPLSCVILQVGKVLANDPAGRSQFVHSGGLAAVQQMAEAPDSKLKEAVDIINSCYPEEVVRYYSPSYR
jgi:hypothetical protein